MARWRLSIKELEERRRWMIEELRRHGIKWRWITCDDCPFAFECKYAYDAANVDGTCIAMD